MKSRGEKSWRPRKRGLVIVGSRLWCGVVVVSWFAGVGRSGGLVAAVVFVVVGEVGIVVVPAVGNCAWSCCSSDGGSCPGGHKAIWA